MVFVAGYSSCLHNFKTLTLFESERGEIKDSHFVFFVPCHNCWGIWLVLVFFIEGQESMRSFGVFARRIVVAYGQLQEDAVGFFVSFVLVAVRGVSLLNRRLEKAERFNVDLRRVLLDKIVV